MLLGDLGHWCAYSLCVLGFYLNTFLHYVRDTGFYLANVIFYKVISFHYCSLIFGREVLLGYVGMMVLEDDV